MAQVLLTAKRVSPNANKDLTSPKMAQLQTEQIVKVKPFKKGISLLYGTSQRPWKRYRMAETPNEFDIAQKLANGLTSVGTLNVAASGTTQATAQALSGIYQHVVTGATGGSNVGVILPAASTKFNAGGAYVVRNDTAVALSVYPAASEYIDSGASNAPIVLAAFGRVHLYPSASNKWLSANSVYE